MSAGEIRPQVEEEGERGRDRDEEESSPRPGLMKGFSIRGGGGGMSSVSAVSAATNNTNTTNTTTTTNTNGSPVTARKSSYANLVALASPGGLIGTNNSSSTAGISTGGAKRRGSIMQTVSVSVS